MTAKDWFAKFSSKSKKGFIITASDWFQKAREENFAIGAFNIDSLAIFKAVMVAASKKKSPVMVEFSPGEVKYFGLRNVVDMVVNAREEYKIPILLNLDHGKPIDLCMEAIEQPGFDNVHFDGSDLEFSENVENTKKVVSAAHKKGLLVEGEIDKISGSSEKHEEDINLEQLKDSYTKVENASRFVNETEVDILATIFGNIHGTFPVQPDLDIDLLRKIQQAIPATFISLHGGSGIAADQVKAAIKEGIVKNETRTIRAIALIVPTNHKNAAGDCAQFHDIVFNREHIMGNWANATSQGSAVGKTMSGQQTVFETASSYSISYFEPPNNGACTFVGVTDSEFADEVISRGSVKQNKMIRIFVKNIDGVMRVVGATIINSTPDVSPLTTAVKNKVDISAYKKNLADSGFDLNELNS